MHTRKHCLIIVPAFNESASIHNVLRKIPRLIDSRIVIDILVVNDGSSDTTAVQVKKFPNVYLVSHILNRGLGVALSTGFTFALMHDYEYAITFDADGQHKIEDLKKVARVLFSNKYDVVIGSRLLAKASKMPPVRKLINRLSNILTFLLFSVWTTDSQSGLRGFSRNALKKLQIRSQKMEVSSEIFKEIRRLGLLFTEVPIESIYTTYSLTKGQRISNAPNVFWRLMIQQFS